LIEATVEVVTRRCSRRARVIRSTALRSAEME
jgi:hypothetical protein